MSRIYWHTQDHGTAELRGSARAHAASLARDITWALIRPGFDAERTLGPYLADRVPVRTTATWEKHAESYLRHDAGRLVVEGEEIPFFEFSLNTLIALNRPLRLLAWMDGLCESHGYFEAEAHDTLAETIREGRKQNMMREGEGWEDVLDLIERLDGDGPIVWSYSVNVGFPGDGRGWVGAVTALRNQDWPVALDPNVDQGFLTGVGAFDLLAQQWRERPWDRERC